jgi:coenzyme F420-0:L-glutamate ligase / coenzyme F420-1:gamma-L-glutamate ligase
MDFRVIGITKIPMVKENNDIAELILNALDEEDIKVDNGDVLIVAETVVSKSEGNIINLNVIKPDSEAIELAYRTGKDPRLVEAILQESKEIIEVGHDFIVSETKHGFICANAGIDESNVDLGMATAIPQDPDESARKIRNKIENITQKKVVVIISDTQGRPFREGAIGVAVGISGMNPLWNMKGENDLYGRKLQTTNIAVADELASAASILMGQADEGIPAVIIKGVTYVKNLKDDSATAKTLIRPKEYDVFR